MWCIAYALGKDPRISEIKRAKCEVLSVEQRSVNKVVKSAKLLLPSMSEQEMSFFMEQFCRCTFGAVSYRIAVQVSERSSRGYSLCPRCRRSIERDYQPYCACCGQHLAW